MQRIHRASVHQPPTICTSRSSPNHRLSSGDSECNRGLNSNVLDTVYCSNQHGYRRQSHVYPWSLTLSDRNWKLMNPFSLLLRCLLFFPLLFVSSFYFNACVRYLFNSLYYQKFNNYHVKKMIRTIHIKFTFYYLLQHSRIYTTMTFLTFKTQTLKSITFIRILPQP